MKRLSETLCITVAIATVLSYVVAYSSGRGMPLSITLSAEVITFFLIIVCLVSLVFLFVVSLAQRKPAVRTFVALALSLLMWPGMPRFVGAPMKIFQIGFRQRIQSTVSPAELREIARICRKTLPMGATLPSPAKTSLWNESEHRSRWNALIQSTALEKLEPGLTIKNGKDAVGIGWGGALIGHWGVIIQTSGKMDAGDIAEGIRTCVDSD